MKFSITRETKNPSRGNIGDAGIDIYVPMFSSQFINDFIKINDISAYTFRNNMMIVYPHKRIKLPTGVYFNIPDDNMLLVLEKTSVPYSTGLISGARVIDSSYHGQFIASLINTADKSAQLMEGQKFIQLVLVPINNDYELQNISYDQLFKDKTSTRGSGAFGSTGLH